MSAKCGGPFGGPFGSFVSAICRPFGGLFMKQQVPQKCAGNAGHFDSAFGGYKDGGGHRYGIRGRFFKNALEC